MLKHPPSLVALAAEALDLLKLVARVHAPSWPWPVEGSEAQPAPPATGGWGLPGPPQPGRKPTELRHHFHTSPSLHRLGTVNWWHSAPETWPGLQADCAFLHEGVRGSGLTGHSSPKTRWEAVGGKEGVRRSPVANPDHNPA